MGAAGPGPSAPGSRRCQGRAPRGMQLSSEPAGADASLRICSAPRVPRPFESRVGEVKKGKSEFLRCNRVCTRAGQEGRRGGGCGGAPRGSAGGPQTRCTAPGARPAFSGLECSRGAVYFVLRLGEGAAGAGLQGPWDLERGQLSVPRAPSRGVGSGGRGAV